jgi:hypothetical protein
MKVYQAIAAVQGELSKTGIAKDRSASGFGASYKFRGIDDVYSALAPLLSKNGLVVIPRMMTRQSTERTTKNGGAMFYVTVHAEFDFVSAEDGSKHTAATFGEAMDSSDKATNKAMSAAYKYAAFMTFAIPTEGDNDADATVHDVAPVKPEPTPADVDVAPIFIDDAQFAQLVTLIETAGVDTRAFCDRYKVDAIKNLPASTFEAATRALKGTIEKNQQKEAA